MCSHIKAYILTLQNFPMLATTTLLSHLQSTGQMPNIQCLLTAQEAKIILKKKEEERENIQGVRRLESVRSQPCIPDAGSVNPPICTFACINCNGSFKTYPFHLGCPAVLNFQTLPSDFYEVQSITGADPRVHCVLSLLGGGKEQRATWLRFPRSPKESLKGLRS